MHTTGMEILAILLLVLANGFFAASEFALIASRKSRIRHMADQGDKAATRTAKLLKQPERFLAAIQVGITFIATFAGVFGGATLVDSLTPVIRDIPISFINQSAQPISIALIVIMISFLSVVIGELMPKYLALAMPERIALKVTRPISLFSKLTYFFVVILTFSAKSVLRLLGFSRLPKQSRINEEDINILVSEGTKQGIFDQTEQKLIKSIFDFSDITVRQSMTPRVDIVGIHIDWPREKVIEMMTRSGFSRYPVFEESLDKISGIIYTKDLISSSIKDNGDNLRDLLRKPLFVPDSMPLTILLSKFQKRKIHIAIVLDEFGGTAGLITLEDILEEIVGEIMDEHDYAQPEFVAHSDKVAFVAASLRPDELNSEFNVDLPEDISDTIGGLIVETLGRVPEMSEELTITDVKLTVLEKDGNRLKRLRVEK